MPVIDYIDGPNRRIHLHADTVDSSVHPMDIYKEQRTLRRTDESLRKYDLFIAAKGNDYKGQDPQGNDRYTERYIVLLDGARIVPYDVAQTLTFTGVMITDDGQEGLACIDKTPLGAESHLDLNYIPPQVEVIVITTGGSALTQEEHDQLMGLPDESVIANAVLDETA